MLHSVLEHLEYPVSLVVPVDLLPLVLQSVLVLLADLEDRVVLEDQQ